MDDEVIEKGRLPFSIEGRILRELGERLVKKPEVALLELIKNSYDADALSCSIEYDFPKRILVKDNGAGMTLEQFQKGWMRIGTSAKEAKSISDLYGREITGEKGIGRFAVRFLGGKLALSSVADDPKLKRRTRLTVDFDWEKFDRYADLGKIQVDYVLMAVGASTAKGTTLEITALRPAVARMEWKQIATGAVGVVSAARALSPPSLKKRRGVRPAKVDPGFGLVLSAGQEAEPVDLSTAVLDRYVLRAVMELSGDQLSIQVYQSGSETPYVSLVDQYKNSIGEAYADIRFFPRRAGTFTDAPIDGRAAYTWVRENSGVLVFDRGFQVRPYGMDGDDWLNLVRDAARNQRNPQATITKQHFAMSREVWADPGENWMLRLPASEQLIGAVHVAGARTVDGTDDGLVAAADREGFVENDAYLQLQDLVRGAVEAIAYADRRLQQEHDTADAERQLQESREITRSAIEEIESDGSLTPSQKNKIVAMLVETQDRLEQHEEGHKEREKQLEIMSLLGVIGGFMTHEFGVAIAELKQAQSELEELAKTQPMFGKHAAAFRRHAEALEGFVAYSRAYVQGAKVLPTKQYAAMPRIRQVVKVFGQYAKDRKIDVEIGVEPDVMVPLIPAALYNGLAQNLFTNALKAVTAKVDGDRRIAFRAWNDRRWHRLQVSDTGIGIPAPVRSKVFDPLFTTTESRNDPLGSGMGLGLALVQRGASAFGGVAELVTPPPGFATCMEVRFPLAS